MEQLENFIVQEWLKQQELKYLGQQEEGVNNALKVLETEGLPTSIDTLSKIIVSDEAFAGWIGKAEASYIGKLGFIPKEEKKRIRETFRAMADRTRDARNTVGHFLREKKFPIIQDGDSTLHYDREEVDKVLTEKYTKRFSDEDKEYYQVILQAKAALQRLYDWEEAHLYVPMNLITQNVGKFLTEEFTKGWFQENIGWRIGKMNPDAIRMLKEQSNDED